MEKFKPIYDIITTEFDFRSNAGRKTKCTPELIKFLFELITRGSNIKDACAIVNLTEASYYNWIARGRKEAQRLEDETAQFIEKEAVFLEFFESMKKAIPLYKLSLLEKLDQAGADSWQSYAWRLERGYPDEYGKRTIIKIETWETEIIDLIRQGTVTFTQVEDELGSDAAKKLFDRSGEERT